MRTIGIDLAVSAVHKAVVMDESGREVSPIVSFRSRWAEIQGLVERAREGVEPDHPLRAVMEPTGMAWFTVAVPLQRLGVTVYLVSGQRVKALRRYYKRHASSDRISARVLAKLPSVDEESLYPLTQPTPTQMACQRGCKQDDWLQKWITAIKNRLKDIDRFAWPGLDKVLPSQFSPTAQLFRRDWYDPQQVVEAGEERLRQAFAVLEDDGQGLGWLGALVDLAMEVLSLYGLEFLDYHQLQQEVCRNQRVLAMLEQEQTTVNAETVTPTYRQLHPERHLESLYGVGEKGAAVYASFIGLAGRFPDNRHFRGWHGLVPESRQSGDAEGKGLHISQAGPNLVKKFAYMNASTARRFDPQIAAIYHDQMVHKGKHHNQAVCACATHLLDRVWVVLRDNRPYDLCDVDGTPVTPKEAQAIISARYTVPEKVRQQTNRRARKERAEKRLEEQRERRSRPRG
ncbi:MAG TPA: IS110 family transposase [Anaerolineae bacterium]|nr:IS110 family transposase [Anaerolineae bacterium]HUW13299.1 IS110 family transposase [Anaerolineae bacterium]